MELRRCLSVVSLVLLLAACGGSDPGGTGNVRVVASFYPLAFVAEEVGGGLVEVENLTPPGAEPHDLELTPGQIRTVAEADLVLSLGGFQPALDDALGEANGVVVDALATQDELLDAPADEHEEDHEDEEHDAETVDPHVWLDPERVARIAATVGDALVEIDPVNADAYRANASELRSRLMVLDTEFRDGLARCERRTIVTSHEAFGYLASAYDLDEVGIAGIDPEAEPSPRRLAEVAELVEESGVTTVFFEVLVSPRTAETLAEETGVRTARLDPLEGAPQAGDYFDAMRANLKVLQDGLGCS